MIQLHCAVIHAPITDINIFFQSVTAKQDKLVIVDYGCIDVPHEYIINVEDSEKALNAITFQKSSSPLVNIQIGCYVTLQEYWEAQYVPYGTILYDQDTYQLYGSLTAVLIKELETFVFRWLWNILGEHIKTDQYGSMKGCSTTMALIEMFDSWLKASDNASTQIRLILLDYRKAFDLIDHNILLAKLMSYGMPLVLLHWVHAFPADRKQMIKGKH